MKKLFATSIIALVPILVFAQTKKYSGAWFDIKYPASFTAKGSLKSASSATGFESAVFESPDHLVEFYVFSPQWSGEATDIALKATEKMVSTKTDSVADQVSTWWTITAKNGSYTRSYQETKNETYNVNRIFGIKYKNQAGLNKYKKEYAAFKASLMQFAD